MKMVIKIASNYKLTYIYIIGKVKAMIALSIINLLMKIFVIVNDEEAGKPTYSIWALPSLLSLQPGIPPVGTGLGRIGRPFTMLLIKLFLVVDKCSYGKESS